MITREDHLIQVIRCLKIIREEPFYTFDFPTVKKELSEHAAAAGETLKSLEILTELCKLRIQWHQKWAGQILRSLSDATVSDYPVHVLLPSYLRMLRYHLEGGRVNLEWFGYSDELLTIINRKYHQEKAQTYITRLRETRCSMDEFARLYRLINYEITKASSTLEDLGSSVEELQGLQVFPI